MRPSKDEVMRFLKPEPATPEELAGLEKLEPGDYEVYSERLNMILAECKEVFIRVGISHFLHSGDLIVGLHTAQGDLVSACLGTFIHSVTAQNPIKWIIRNFTDNPAVGVREGDIFYCNDATYGGIHNADQMAILPIFHRGELIAWASAGTHIHEMGGIEPGGLLAGAGRSGGHGYGDVLEPEPQAVVDDVRDGIISDWAARNVYHVAYDAETWTVGALRTAELRQNERADRLRRSARYADFEAAWVRRRPPADMLSFYGSWPDARIVTRIIRI